MNTKIFAFLVVCILASISMHVDAQSPDVCYEPQKTGPCRARMERWAYEPSTNECVMFIYGGCRANGNNFRTKRQCEATCVQD